MCRLQLKKLIILLFLSGVLCVSGYGQTRYAFVDMEYILNHIPDYSKVMEELNVYSQKLQGEVDQMYKDIEELQDKYNSDKVFLTPVMRERREKEIAEKENKARLLQEDYFGTSGELFRKREDLLKPILDEVNEVITDMAKEGNFGLILDVSRNNSVLYYDSKLDRSASVLRKLGYSPVNTETENN